VGTSYDGRNTPLFSETMKYVIFRPYWNVPPKIAAKELVPKAWANPYYFANNDYEIVSEYGDSGRVHPVTAASLRAVADGKLKLRQRTGQHNALGRIKFLFPNEFSVYLHDTPSRHLFERRERDFSHGCIRVQNPADLAAFVLSDQPEWTRERIESHLHGNKQKQANLKTPVEVYIGYWTVSADAEGNARFFEDIYGYDARMMQLSGKS
jgi:murein L,D-transpeptidase YcbB/YkuD